MPILDCLVRYFCPHRNKCNPCDCPCLRGEDGRVAGDVPPTTDQPGDRVCPPDPIHICCCPHFRHSRFRYFEKFEMCKENVLVFLPRHQRAKLCCFADTVRRVHGDEWYCRGRVVCKGNIRVSLNCRDSDLVLGQAIIDALEAILCICGTPGCNTERRILGGRVAINDCGVYVAITNVQRCWEPLRYLYV